MDTIKRKNESQIRASDPLEIMMEAEQRRLFLRYITYGWLIFGVMALAVLPFFPEQRVELSYLVIVIFPTCLITHLLNRLERAQLAGIVFTIMVDVSFYGLFLVLARTMGVEKVFDTQVSVWMLMGLAIPFAGAFIHRRASLIFALINTVLFITTHLVLAPSANPRLGTIVFWWMLAFVIFLYERTLNMALTRVLDELATRKQIETALRTSEAQYRSLVEKIPGAVMLHFVAQPRKVVYVSPGVEDLLGYTVDEWMNDKVTWKKVIHPLDTERILDEDVHKKTRNDFFKAEYRMLRKDGSWIWVSEHSSMITNSAGQPLYWQCLYLNITERKEAENELLNNVSRLRLATRLARLGVWDWEIATDKTSWHGEMFNIYGVKPDEFTGKWSDYIQFTREDYRQRQNDGITAVSNNSLTLEQIQKDYVVPFNPIELCIVRPDNTEVYTLGEAIAVADEQGLPARMIGVTIDITERKRSEQEREKLIAELTSKNAELERFVYTVSHDLKSPLVTIRGFMGYLEQDATSGNMERLKHDLLRISSAVEKMQALLNSLLELSRIGRFVNPSQLVPFEELAREAVSLVDARAREGGITIKILPDPSTPVIYGDKSRLIEVLQNLLENAVKYMGGQSEPWIEVGQRGMETEHGNPIFYVWDNGMGIAPEYHERVFGLFNKLDARSEGTGIGLTLVRRILEFHGCKIWVESEVGKGARFCFTLPRSP
ncbi:MAG: PAS domain-containing protein [Anaerolineales bacterium]|nr:PAS domain-containing protein [Anaerolineales bacterium]